MRKFLIFPIIVVLALTFLSVSAVLAQNSTSTDEATLDENVTAEDLDITDPKILPDSPWYGLKKLWENIQEIFTFNPLENAKLQLQRANQRILEAQKLAEKTGNDEAFGRVIENYQRQIEKIEKRLDKLVQKRDAKVDKFIDKFAEYQIKHRKILEKLEEIKPDLADEIEAIKDSNLEKLSKVLSAEDKARIEEIINTALENIPGSNLKNLKNLEILEALEEKVPEQAKEAIRQAQANALKRFKQDLTNIPDSSRSEEVEQYIKKIKGDKGKMREIIKQLGDLKNLADDEADNQDNDSDEAADDDTSADNDNANTNTNTESQD
ncbi:MAG: hypothetical protein A3B89_02320 [Candidatus Buchananbacteria bacterium RIFCSPHIGHO2_02_FULL_40_13]|uniref:DUF5667 domain-containing protein n=1 Tax=Candidatus Buchananbacteria bacterium RIFCSPLOWO2_01_FULL_39_33 TaxID=1797543 RepID=A0A1G1YJD8_9BACT|nr:MAG: hypothetical protein A3B89_02320 [Candidatus Buchananbacteria bacterium RIFCSPHIGHO2_02_FULL_40_13]OGY52391.1 MAG: hypothetical protein A3A02_02820 [Candidatus Buchananbacteria bacterium RIFCSPLOWO2_01_FULL_39_33]